MSGWRRTLFTQALVDSDGSALVDRDSTVGLIEAITIRGVDFAEKLEEQSEDAEVITGLGELEAATASNPGEVLKQ